MNPLQLIEQIYQGSDQARQILLDHSTQVAELATVIAGRLFVETVPVDLVLVEESALLHDIGMIYTDSPQLGCFGTAPYMAHGVLGAELLAAKGLHRHAMICERHIGVGLTVSDIQAQSLPLPLRDMTPRTIEEQIVAYADLFFSKSRPQKRSAEQVRSSLARLGEEKAAIFDTWHQRFAWQQDQTTVISSGTKTWKSGSGRF